MIASFRDRIAAVIGNLLEHYDKFLFGLIAPFIAPLFFEESDPVVALLCTYGMLPLGFLMRPLGAIYFGWIGERYGVRRALCISLWGMAFVTMGMGCIPIYRDIGVLAPVCLALGRMLQGFFAAGETSGGAIFILERTSPGKRSLVSGLYNVSSVGGSLLASGAVMILSYFGNVETHWRVLFWIGGSSAILGVILRLTMQKEDRKLHPKRRFKELFSQHFIPFLVVILVAGSAHMAYAFVFPFMNGYIPLLTGVSRETMAQTNTMLLFASVFCLPCFGYLATKVKKEMVMSLGLFGFAFSTVLLLNDMENVFWNRWLLLFSETAIVAPYYAWAFERTPPAYRYWILPLGSALGSELIGMPTPAICLWLYKVLGWSIAPTLYVSVVAAGALFALHFLTAKKRWKDAVV
jgi:MFS family permease